MKIILTLVLLVLAILICGIIFIILSGKDRLFCRIGLHKWEVVETYWIDNFKKLQTIYKCKRCLETKLEEVTP